MHDDGDKGECSRLDRQKYDPPGYSRTTFLRNALRCVIAAIAAGAAVASIPEYERNHWGRLDSLVEAGIDDPERPRALNAAVRSEYALLAGISPAALTAAMELYLPIVRVFAHLGPAPSPAQRERLIQHVEATLRPED